MGTTAAIMTAGMDVATGVARVGRRRRPTAGGVRCPSLLLRLRTATFCMKRNCGWCSSATLTAHAACLRRNTSNGTAAAARSAVIITVVTTRDWSRRLYPRIRHPHRFKLQLRIACQPSRRREGEGQRRHEDGCGGCCGVQVAGIGQCCSCCSCGRGAIHLRVSHIRRWILLRLVPLTVIASERC